MSNSPQLTSEQIWILAECSNDYEPFIIVLEYYREKFGPVDASVVQKHIEALIKVGLLEHHRAAADAYYLVKVEEAPEGRPFDDQNDMFLTNGAGKQLIDW